LRQDDVVADRRTPTPLLAVAFIVVVVLVVASIATGQWWLTVLGLIALAAAAVPLRNRR
jgi:hypothetical protein